MKTKTKNYNGWTNYETWNCKLWMDNDQGLQEMFNEEASRLIGRYDEGEARRELADYVKSWVEDNSPINDTATMYTDLLNAAICKINYYEIAQALIDDNKGE